MKRCALFLAILGCAPATAPAPRRTTEPIERVEAATKVIHEAEMAADAAIPLSIAHAARCVAVVPGLLNAGLVLGARAGGGIVSCRSKDGWSDPRFFMVSSATAGAQAGVARVDLVMLAMTEASESAFLARKLELGGGIAFAAGPIGRSVQATSDVTLKPVLTYSRVQGVFAGIDIGALNVDADEDAARAFYGDERDLGVLLRGSQAVPESAMRFRAELARVFGPS